MKKGEVLAIISPTRVFRGFVTIESVDHASKTIKLSDFLPAGTSEGDLLCELGPMEGE